MIDRPDAPTLLNAVADALIGRADPTSPDDAAADRYLIRIAANLCRILAREAEAGPAADAATVDELRVLLDRWDGSLDDLVAALDDAIRTGVDLDPADLHRVLLANTVRRLAIARPGYAHAQADG